MNSMWILYDINEDYYNIYWNTKNNHKIINKNYIPIKPKKLINNN